MNSYVRVESDPTHPEGPIVLWVKDNFVNLTVDDARTLAASIMDLAGVPEVPPAPEPEPPPAPPEDPADAPPA